MERRHFLLATAAVPFAFLNTARRIRTTRIGVKHPYDRSRTGPPARPRMDPRNQSSRGMPRVSGPSQITTAPTT